VAAVAGECWPALRFLRLRLAGRLAQDYYGAQPGVPVLLKDSYKNNL
jgi:hypothetical protein